MGTSIVFCREFSKECLRLCPGDEVHLMNVSSSKARLTRSLPSFAAAWCNVFDHSESSMFASMAFFTCLRGWWRISVIKHQSLAFYPFQCQPLFGNFSHNLYPQVSLFDSRFFQQGVKLGLAWWESFFMRAMKDSVLLIALATLRSNYIGHRFPSCWLQVRWCHCHHSNVWWC